MELTILFIVMLGVWLGRNVERMKVRWTLMKGQMSQQMAQNCNQNNGCHCCNCNRNNGPRNNGNNRNNRNRNNRNRNNYRQNNGGNRQNNGGNPRQGAWMN